ncbi:MAG: SpoIIE family protein phosphatase [Thermodesulfobacteriota bacterium]
MPIKILVVDDEPDLELIIGQKFRKKVRSNEYAFFFARNGVQAINRLRENDLDIVLTDINMPEMDGLTLLSEIKEEYPLLRSIIISAYGDMANIRKALNQGAFDFITKPIDLNDLEMAVARTVDEVLALRQAEFNKEQLIAIRNELEVARTIQNSMVPAKFPPYPDRDDFDIYAKMITAKEVGGDFYDYSLIDNHHLYFAIGDVAGKGVPAALFMAVTRTLLKSVALKMMQPNECLDKVNSVLCWENASDMFVTAFCGVLNTATGELTYSNAGHNLPYLLVPQESAINIKQLENTEGMALGVFDYANYQINKMSLKGGDGLFLYTDGITETMDKAGNLFSAQRLEEHFRISNYSSSEEIIKGIFDEISRFSDSAPQADDITALSVRYLKY